jgi:hypothetical protein
MKFTKLILAIFFSAFCAYLYFSQKKATPTAPPSHFAKNETFLIQTQKILPLPTSFTYMEIFPIGKDFLVGTWNKNEPSPLFYLRAYENNTFKEETSNLQGLKGAIHPRHAIAFDFNGDKKEDIILADHGKDEIPFPGGNPQIFFSEKNQWKSLNIPSLTNQQFFTYHLSAMKYKNKKYLYFSNLRGPSGSKPQLWEISGSHNFIDKSNLLPKILRQESLCFMSSNMTDLDKDGVAELLLGGCDTGPGEKAHQRDLIFRFDESKGFIPLDENSLAPRKLDSTWGTSYFAIDDFDQNGLKDILALTHNKGFSESVMQLHLQKGKLQFESLDFPYKSSANSFVVWASTGDVNGDSYPDIVFSIKYKDAGSRNSEKTFRLFMNRNGSSFVDATDQLNLGDHNFVGIHFLPKNSDGRQSLFALDHEGNYHIATMKRMN